MADVEQMFYCYVVREDHRDFLRFLWFKNNDPKTDISEFRMKVHVFGDSPSTAIAAYGRGKTASNRKENHGCDARHYVERNFYVDDGLVILPTPVEAIDLLTRTKVVMPPVNLHLHKITSNSMEVMLIFSTASTLRIYVTLTLMPTHYLFSGHLECHGIWKQIPTSLFPSWTRPPQGGVFQI